MKYDYKCKNHGVIELSHSMKENRNNMKCPECGDIMKPLISSNVGLILTGRPPWAYNDFSKAIEHSKNNGDGRINENTTLTDNRENSKYKGQKRKMDKNMGNFNAQW
jgi:predicted nucleic acid-binding Zn ribbon protein